MGTNEFYQLMKRASDYTFDNIPSSAVNEKTIEDFSLVAFPNPAEGDVTIRFIAPRPLYAQVVLMDMIGKQIDILYENNVPSGYNFVTLNSELYAKGMYFVNLKLGENSAFTKVLLK
jgi:hypothetical protein